MQSSRGGFQSLKPKRNDYANDRQKKKATKKLNGALYFYDTFVFVS
jgi:hypothetical protein